MVAWRSKDLNQPFEFLGKAITPRSDEEDDWDNHRIQDPDIAYIPELKGHVMTCNMNIGIVSENRNITKSKRNAVLSHLPNNPIEASDRQT